MPARSRTCGALESRKSEPGRGLEEKPIPSPDTPSFDCPRVRTALSPPLRVACCARDTNFHRRRLEALLTLSLLSHLLRSPNGRFGLGIEEVEAFGVYNYPNRIAGLGARARIEATENRHVVVLSGNPWRVEPRTILPYRHCSCRSGAKTACSLRSPYRALGDGATGSPRRPRTTSPTRNEPSISRNVAQQGEVVEDAPDKNRTCARSLGTPCWCGEAA